MRELIYIALPGIAVGPSNCVAPGGRKPEGTNFDRDGCLDLRIQAQAEGISGPSL